MKTREFISLKSDVFLAVVVVVKAKSHYLVGKCRHKRNILLSAYLFILFFKASKDFLEILNILKNRMVIMRYFQKILQETCFIFSWIFPCFQRTIIFNMLLCLLEIVRNVRNWKKRWFWKDFNERKWKFRNEDNIKNMFFFILC